MSLMQKSKSRSVAATPEMAISDISIGGDGQSHVQPDGLARRFIDMLLADAGAGPQKKSTKSDDVDPIDELLGDFDDEGGETEAVYLSVDLAVAAVRLGRAIEAEPGLLRALRKDNPVVVIETGDAGANSEVEKVLEVCVLGRSTETLSPHHFDAAAKKWAGRKVAIFERDGAFSPKDARDWDKRIGHALQARFPIVGIAADPATQLPKDLVRAADHRISLDPLGKSGIALVISAVTGEPPSNPLDENLARNVDLSDLRIAISSDRGADGSASRLAEVVERRLSVTDSAPCLEELFGYGDAKDIGLAIVADLAAYHVGKIPWSSVDRGLLLEGPPGTGKTTFARALAKSARLPLVIGSLAQWQASKDGHLGHCLSAMRETFAEAKKRAPCILFIDELDSFGDRTNFAHHNRDYSTQVVNGLLESLDGAGGRQGVVAIGATNNASEIDSAITRAGRLDRTVRIPLPDMTALSQILRFHLKTDLGGVDLAAAAIAARGGSGADCKSWVRRARGVARRTNREMTIEDLVAAIRDGRSSLPDDVRKLISVHEAGHALVAIALGVGTPSSLTIHDVGGTTQIAHEVRAMTAAGVIAEIAHALAGREAEILVFGESTAGSGGGENSDLALATKLAVSFDGSWGLGELGPLWLGDPETLAEPIKLTAFSKRTGAILRHAQSEARRALVQNRERLGPARHGVVEDFLS